MEMVDYWLEEARESDFFILTDWPVLSSYHTGQSFPISPSLRSSFRFFVLLFFSFWLPWAFLAVHGLSVVVVSWGKLSRCGVWSSHVVASLAVEHRL